MGKFKNLKLAGRLRLLISLCAIQRNTKRWSSTSEMIKRYYRLKPFFTQGTFDKMPELIDYMLSAREENDLQLLNETLQKFNSLTIALQRESIDISEVRVLFNEIIRHDVNIGTYLSSNADIIHSKTFESALVKIIDNREHELFLKEKESVNKLLKQSEITPVSTDHDLDFASKLLKKRKLEEMSSDSRYVNCRFLVPTSNITERFFSASGYAI